MYYASINLKYFFTIYLYAFNILEHPYGPYDNVLKCLNLTLLNDSSLVLLLRFFSQIVI